MPIEYHLDHELRLVLARATGALTDRDIFDYQEEVWSRPDVAGYDELIDMSAVERIVPPSTARVMQLAVLSASMDAGKASKFAIVAPDNLAFGLGRMYAAHRSLSERSRKQVGVFRSMPEALAWLGIDGDAPSHGSEPDG